MRVELGVLDSWSCTFLRVRAAAAQVHNLVPGSWTGLGSSSLVTRTRKTLAVADTINDDGRLRNLRNSRDRWILSRPTLIELFRAVPDRDVPSVVSVFSRVSPLHQ